MSSTTITCPRCGGPTNRWKTDNKTLHYRCSADGCDPPGMYMGEHPIKFWTLLIVGMLHKIALAFIWLARRLGRWLARSIPVSRRADP